MKKISDFANIFYMKRIKKAKFCADVICTWPLRGRGKKDVRNYLHRSEYRGSLLLAGENLKKRL